MKRITVEEMIRSTDSLTYLNALKSTVSELKEELAIVDETREYQAQAIERARKIIRRLDNQYRAIVKATAKLYHPPSVHLNAEIALEDEDDDEGKSDDG